MKYAVTGGAGFIGSMIVRKLLEKPENQVIVCDMLGDPASLCWPTAIDFNRVKIYATDIMDRQTLESDFAGLDGVFHCAAYSKIANCIKNPDIAIDVNVKGTLNVLYAAKLNKVKRVVYSASASAYGEQATLAHETDPVKPINIYGATKYFGEVLCRQFAEHEGLDTVSLRYFNVFGSEMAVIGRSPFPSVVERFLYARIGNQPLTIVGDGQQRRDLVSVEDVAIASIRAMEDSDAFKGDVFNISSGVNYSILEIAEMVGGPTKSVNSFYKEPQQMSGSITKAELCFGFKPNRSALKEFVTRIKQKYNI